MQRAHKYEPHRSYNGALWLYLCTLINFEAYLL